MNVSETMIWYKERLEEGLTGEEMEELLDEIEAAEKAAENEGFNES